MYIISILFPSITGIILLMNGNKYGIIGSKILSVICLITSFFVWIYSFSLKFLFKVKNSEILNKEEIIIFKNIINNKDIIETFSFNLNTFNLFMTGLVLIISSLVVFFSFWYMQDDPHIIRFISLLLIFSTAMMIFVNSNNLMLTYIGWEFVGLLSYLLINFWYNNINSNKSSMKAIFYNKIGDISLLLILLYSFYNYNNSYLLNFSINSWYNISFSIINIFFLLAILAKSAQFIFLPWLGDAMAGPTPVSALLHAATMVTAGVYLGLKLDEYILEVFNTSEFYSYLFLIITIFTILFAGFNSISQYDIKKIIAYSTASQLAYMLISYILFNPSLTFFHLITHAFFKALLFLSAGIIIHNSFYEQDLRKFGSLFSKIKRKENNNSYKFSFIWSYISFLFSSFSLVSFPYFSGYYSKESIIYVSLYEKENKIIIYLYLILGVILTTIYTYRLFFYMYYAYPNRALNYSSFLDRNFKMNNSYSLFSQNKDFYLRNLYDIPYSYLFIFIFLILSSIFLGKYIEDIFIINTNVLFHIIPSQLQFQNSYFDEIVDVFILLLPFLSLFGILILRIPSFFYSFSFFIPSFILNIYTHNYLFKVLKIITLKIFILSNKRFFFDFFINFISSLFFSLFFLYTKIIEYFYLSYSVLLYRLTILFTLPFKFNLKFRKGLDYSPDPNINHSFMIFYLFLSLFLLGFIYSYIFIFDIYISSSFIFKSFILFSYLFPF